MHLTLTKATTALLLKGVRKVISKKTTLPVLEHLLVEGGAARQVSITADSLEERLTFRVPDEEIADGSGEAFLVPFEDLKAVAANLRKHDILHIEPDGGSVMLTRDGDGIRVPYAAGTMPADEFPSGEGEIDVPEGNPRPLLDAIKTLAPFASTEENRRVLTGVFHDHEKRCMVATDGRRLTRIQVDDAFPLERDAILPTTALLKNGVLSDETGGATVANVGEEPMERLVLGVNCGPWRYQVRCIEGRYANYEQVIPQRDARHPCLEIGESNLPMLSNALKQVCSGKGNGDTYVALYADATGVSLCIPQESETTPFTAIEVAGAKSANVATNASVWFPAKQLIDAFNAGYHQMEITGSHSPARFTGPENSLHIVMPARECGDAGLIEFMGGEVPEETQSPPQAAPTTTYGTDPKPTQPQGAHDMSSTENTPQPQSQTPEAGAPSDDRDALTVFMDQLSDTQEKVREANSAVRDLKKSAKQLERDFKDREKDIRAREREFEKNARLIQQLQQTVTTEHRKAA